MAVGGGDGKDGGEYRGRAGQDDEREKESSEIGSDGSGADGFPVGEAGQLEVENSEQVQAHDYRDQRQNITERRRKIAEETAEDRGDQSDECGRSRNAESEEA